MQPRTMSTLNDEKATHVEDQVDNEGGVSKLQQVSNDAYLYILVINILITN